MIHDQSHSELFQKNGRKIFCKILSVLPSTVINTCFLPPVHQDIPSPLPALAQNVRASLTNAENVDLIQTFSTALSFNDSQLSELEKCSRNQSGSNSWWEQRKGRITASRFHDVYQKVQTLFRNKDKRIKCRVTPLLLDLLEPKMLTNVPSLEWGKKNEGKAAEAFMKVEGIRHKHPKLILCGLFVFKPHPYLGATPDNIFICKCCSERYCVEYKCPFSICNEQISDSWHKTSFLEKVDGSLQLKRSHKYYTQINGQMVITGITQSYFVVWTTQRPPFIEKIYFDKSFMGQSIVKFNCIL